MAEETRFFEHEQPARPGSPGVVRRLLSVVVGVIAWVVSVVGAVVMATGAVERVQMLRFDRTTTVYLLIGLVVLLVALVVWTLSAWLSSTGLLLTGLVSLAYGLLTFFTPSSMRLVFRLTDAAPVRFRSAALYLAAGPFPIIVGVLLLVGGTSAFVARRAGRRDVRRTLR